MPIVTSDIQATSQTVIIFPSFMRYIISASKRIGSTIQCLDPNKFHYIDGDVRSVNPEWPQNFISAHDELVQNSPKAIIAIPTPVDPIEAKAFADIMNANIPDLTIIIPRKNYMNREEAVCLLGVDRKDMKMFFIELHNTLTTEFSGSNIKMIDLVDRNELIMLGESVPFH